MKQSKKELMVVGLTGGVGCGKTFVGEIIKKTFEIPVILADNIGHMGFEPGTETYDEVVEEFGTGILNEDETVNRARLGEIVFANETKLQRLNQIIHPFVRSFIEAGIQEARGEGRYSRIIVEAANLFESGLCILCDEIWYVTAREELRRKRLSDKRGWSREKIDAVMKVQFTEEEFIKRGDAVIFNNGGEEEIISQLEFLLV